MRRSHYERFLEQTFLLEIDQEDSQIVTEGTLINRETKEKFSVVRGIPRFVKESEDYAFNFGLQWNLWQKTQLDSNIGAPESRTRLFETTGWMSSNLVNKTVLEIGCGAGRFTEVLADDGAMVIATDLSLAIEANYRNNGWRENVFLMQADGRAIPLSKDSIDYLLVLGVLQHCPDPKELIIDAVRLLKQGGQFSADMYKKSAFHPLRYGKYLWRPLTKRMPPKLLLSLLRFYVPIALSLDETISRIPGVGRVLATFSLLPVANPDHYVSFPLNQELRKEWALLDTFDALAPKFDLPLTEKEWQALVDDLPLKDLKIGRRGIHTVNAHK